MPPPSPGPGLLDELLEPTGHTVIVSGKIQQNTCCESRVMTLQFSQSQSSMSIVYDASPMRSSVVMRSWYVPEPDGLQYR
jgi:hypothetical protein